MRLISGCAANVELETPGGSAVRPTLVRSRKALFDHLGDLRGARVLDLFSGSGALGLEAASRGAAYLASVEKNAGCAQMISRNAEKVRRTGCAARMELFVRDALDAGRFLPGNEPFDLVFADPPYAESAAYCRKLFSDAVFKRKIRGAKVVWEIPDFPGAVGEFLLLDLPGNDAFRKFGVTTFYLGVWEK